MDEAVSQFKKAQQEGAINERKLKPWIANKDELFARTQYESSLTKEELAKLAEDWREFIDPITELLYYVNQKTLEMSYAMPAAWAMRIELQELNEKNKRNFDEMQEKLEAMYKINGGKKRKMALKNLRGVKKVDGKK